MKAFLRKNSKPALGVVLLLPALISIFVTTLYPAICNIYLSCMEWNGFSAAMWNGLENYKQIFGDRVTMLSFKNSILIALIITVFATVMGAVFAFLIIRMKKKEGAFYRLVLFTPVMLPMTVVALLFALLYNYEMGLFNSFLRLVGLDSLTRAWLADPSTLIGAISFTAVWKQWGLAMMLVYTAVMSVPAELFDACEIDGCSYIKRIYMVILPLIRPTIQTTLMLTLTFGFKSYDIVWIMTKGGPADLSTVVPIRMLQYGFQFNEFGTAAAAGTLFTVLVVVAVYMVQGLMRGEVYEY